MNIKKAVNHTLHSRFALISVGCRLVNTDNSKKEIKFPDHVVGKNLKPITLQILLFIRHIDFNKFAAPGPVLKERVPGVHGLTHARNDALNAENRERTERDSQRQEAEH
jgi:hypothetical protein